MPYLSGQLSNNCISVSCIFCLKEIKLQCVKRTSVYIWDNCYFYMLTCNLMWFYWKCAYRTETYERFLKTRIVIDRRPINRRADRAPTTVYNNPVKRFHRVKNINLYVKSHIYKQCVYKIIHIIYTIRFLIKIDWTFNDWSRISPWSRCSFGTLFTWWLTNFILVCPKVAFYALPVLVISSIRTLN